MKKVKNIFLISSIINLMVVLILPSVHCFSHDLQEHSKKNIHTDLLKPIDCKICNFHLYKTPEVDFTFFKIVIYTSFFFAGFALLSTTTDNLNLLSFQLRAPPSL
ncbi:hypothetical protein SAMN04488096_101107 [Mesonia phycicola]|uniref:Uncharacterized protein n=1 Tax=Mesonia phycicola TaxID=579105 RepID=A0A1M6A6S4_9FLAO|nr:hypothetical protein [Mesonia phycicola]SHI32145.1 hypothetical protein SAMN04488096_101107 [Mesonia phycicola]